MPSADTLPPASVISWSSDASDWDGTILRYGILALLGGMALLALLLIVLITPGLLREGEYGVLMVLAASLLFGGPVSYVVVAAAVSRGELSKIFPNITAFRLGPSIAACVVGAVAIVAFVRYPSLFYAVPVLGLALLVVRWLRHGTGTLDVEAKTFTIPKNEQSSFEYSLDGLRSFSTYPVADTVVFRLRYVGTKGLSGPSVMSVPADRADEVSVALASIADESDTETGVSKTAAAVLAVFGVGFLSLAVAPWVLLQFGDLPRASRGFATYFSLFLGTFGALFVLLAVRSQR
ncbi:hypothetical protein ACFQJC_05430 [Haloferax namakaokahaiae]|uniref:PH domain-containing protein n=1 Tax=Haloferax namakaokahaiae TaxID=1748331 RepID=A0ABD5ZCS8_9EURY